MTNDRKKHTRAHSPAGQTAIQLEEYRALYGLLVMRVQAIERRVPLIGASLAGIVATLSSVAPEGKEFLLWSIPVALVWFVRTTISHTRSLEDLLRRIEQIERAVNARSGSDLLVFQSSHPSRGVFVGGRTSGESILAALLWCGILLIGAGSLHTFRGDERVLFVSYLIAVGLYLFFIVGRYAKYRYERETSDHTN